jgi:hypothetical protein
LKLWTHTAQHNTYRDFRETVEPVMFSGGAICVRWCGMFVCIEPDGYSHT